MSECVEWGGFRNSDGYGIRTVNRRRMRAHRAAYEEEVGPIPEGLVLDHLCGNRACINVEHLEPVTRGENSRRGAIGQPRTKTECKQGHPFVKGSFSLMRGGTDRKYMVKRCLICHRERERLRRSS